MQVALSAAAAPGNAVLPVICRARHGATLAGMHFIKGGSASLLYASACDSAKRALSGALSGEQVERQRRWRPR